MQDIRRANNLFGNDMLLHARHYVVIPGYQGPSLSSEPEENEEVEMRKVALKRFQLLSKCVDYKMATIYMESSNWDIDEVLLTTDLPLMIRLCKSTRMTWNGRKRIRRRNVASCGR